MYHHFTAVFDLFNHNPKEFLYRFVTVDEIWIQWYTPEVGLLAGTVMTTVFCDSQGVICIYLKQGKADTYLYYADLLGRFDLEMRRELLHLTPS